MSDVKWQYFILAAVFIGAAVLSLWTATRVDMSDIEQGLTNVSEESESLIEGGNVLLYVGIVVTLLLIAIAIFVYLSKHRS